MATPVRFPSGISTDQKWQPLADFGLPNPFDYHVIADDFDQLSSGQYTVTPTSTGTVAAIAADGGALLFSTAATTNDTVSLQVKNATFALLTNKKTFYMTRIRFSDVVNTAFTLGMINTTTTPFAPTDGVFFSKASGSATNLALTSIVTGVSTTITIPVGAYSLVNATDIDIGFLVDAKGVINAFVGANLFGFASNSGTGLLNPNRGAVATITGATLTSVLVNPTIAVSAGSAAVKTLQTDLLFAARER